jgi:hypothetical protein
MSDVGQNNGAAVVQYVIEIDGSKHSEHASFVDAIKHGLLLREQNPEAKIKVRDLSELAATEHRAAA